MLSNGLAPIIHACNDEVEDCVIINGMCLLTAYCFIINGMYMFLTDIDECSVTANGGCEQVCTNTIGSFFCECTDGFELDENTFNCTGKLIVIVLKYSS